MVVREVQDDVDEVGGGGGSARQTSLKCEMCESSSSSQVVAPSDYSMVTWTSE